MFIIVGKHGLSYRDLMPLCRRNRKLSWIWKGITRPLSSNSAYASFVKSSFGFSLGDGCYINFETDEWVDGVVLKLAFPRMFVLAIKNEEKIIDFGE
ncbi:hypothetical protein REPUB_Repub16aG0005100 [Reevesia pubescens]